MQTLFHRITGLIFIALIVLFSSSIKAASSFEIQIFDGAAEIMRPYTLISGKQYRLQAISSDEKILPAQWFLSGNLGKITTDMPPMLTAVFVGEGSLICRVADVEQRVGLSVVPETKVIGGSGGKLQSPADVAIDLPKGALAAEEKIGIEIVAPPALPPTLQRFVRVVRISPEGLVLKRLAQLAFLFQDSVFMDAKPQLYFWEAYEKKWVPLQGREDKAQGGVTTSINHFGIYALMAAVPEDLKHSERLEIRNLELSPRVFFAPDRHRLTIAYRLNAPDATQVFVTIDIFDLRGRRVRRLLEEVPRYIGPNAVQWDGVTDNGTLVRNGRYLLVIRARTGSQRAVYRKLIIVFK
ncbi:hypothetical protein F4055_16040 [Candidatus Poribacteria bacterium]|nr:hypothetical protein [Candidatus Poribacteria bacterium]